MKPAWPGYADGGRQVMNLPDGSQETWEWRCERSAPLFTISTNVGQSFTGLTRDEAARLAGLIFKDESINRIDLMAVPPKGDWHLVETIKAPQEAAVSLPSDATAR